MHTLRLGECPSAPLEECDMQPSIKSALVAFGLILTGAGCPDQTQFTTSGGQSGNSASGPLAGTTGAVAGLSTSGGQSGNSASGPSQGSDATAESSDLGSITVPDTFEGDISAVADAAV